MYFLIFCINSNLHWIDNKKPLSQQFDQIAKYKINTEPKDFCTDETIFLYPLLKYAYDLEFDEKPNYTKIRFDLQ